MTAVLCAVLAGWAVCVWPAHLSGSVVRRSTDGAARTRRPRGAQQTASSVATAIDLLGLALGSGVPLTTAINAVAARSGPVVRRDLDQVLAALRWGVDEQAAWAGLPEIWQPAGRALALASVAGVPPAGLLHRTADDIRRREHTRLREASARLGVRIVIPLGLCFLPAFALLTVVPAVATLASQLLTGR